jgi:hypothetical protein
MYGYSGGFSRSEILKMPWRERDWFERRILKQKEDEAAQIQKVKDGQ